MHTVTTHMSASSTSYNVQTNSVSVRIQCKPFFLMSSLNELYI